jgi:ATP-dependent helicase YprA (DUF1998 family)
MKKIPSRGGSRRKSSSAATKSRSKPEEVPGVTVDPEVLQETVHILGLPGVGPEGEALPGFGELGLIPELLEAVKDAGYTSPTPIQQQAIPPALLGRDLIGLAQTGTGKTAGFTLPIIQRLLEQGQGVKAGAHRVRVLVLTPTRELCIQV